MIKFFLSLFSFLISNTALASKPMPWQINLQEAASPIMSELHNFHNLLLVITFSIVLFVLFLIIYVISRFHERINTKPAKFTHNSTIEVIWTVIPIIILVIIAIPSFRILKIAEHNPPAELTVKVVGSQWLWTYSYPDYDIEFDSYMIQDQDLKAGQLRLLEVDNRLLVPEGAVVKFLITASDVIHSFSVPSLGIKTDAVPGRTNETWTKIDKKGVYYGQCSELCGVNHGFMPIAIEVVSRKDFENWVKESKLRFASHNIILTKNR